MKFINYVLILILFSQLISQEKSDDLSQFNLLYNQKDYTNALVVLKRLSANSPYHGEYYYSLGDLYYKLNDYNNAIISFEKSLKYGIDGKTYAYMGLSKAYIKTGDDENGFKNLIQSFKLNIEFKNRIEKDDLFKEFRNEDEYIKLISGKTLPENHSKTDAWLADLEYFKTLVEETHYAPFAKQSRSKWESEINRVKEAIPKLKDYEIICEFQRIAALPNDGHTAIYNPRLPAHTDQSFHHLPILLYYFNEKLYVRAADPKYKDLVGKQVLKFGNKTVADIETNLLSHHGYDNKMQFYWQAPWYMVIPEILAFYDATESITSAELTVADENGAVSNHLIETDQLLTKSYQNSTAPVKWLNMHGGLSKDSPYYLQNPNDTFWHKYDPVNQLLYVQINKIRDKKKQKLSDYFNQVIDDFKSTKSIAMVIDIRLNNGGNTRLTKPLIQAIIQNKRLNERGNLFVITSRNTFSAAMNFSSALNKWTNAIFVGEATGSSPNFVGEEKNVNLPYSQLSISISNIAWIGGLTSDDKRNWIAPDLGAVLTANDFRMNRDPSLEAIWKYLKKK